MLPEKTIERLVTFVHRLEDKLISVKSIHEKLQELLSIVSTTHESILDELEHIKSVLHQVTIDQHVNQIPTNAPTKSSYDEHEEKDNERRSSFTDANVESARKENPRRSEHSARTRFSKSVSFSFEKNLLLPPRLSKETSDGQLTPTLPSPSDVFKTNSSELSSPLRKVLTHVRIHEIEPKNGEYLRLLNVSNSEDYDLSGHFLQQNTPTRPLARFRFPFNTIIRAGQTITIWCGHAQEITPQPPHVFVWKEQRKWDTGPECLTILAKPNGQSIGWFRNSLPISSDQSSSDILFVHSKSNVGLTDSSNMSTPFFNRTPSRLSARPTRLAAFHSLANSKSPFTHSPGSVVHPDYHGSHTNTPTDLRSQLNQRVGLSHLFPRAKSSSFAGRSMDKQDLTRIRLSQTGQQPNTVQT